MLTPTRNSLTTIICLLSLTTRTSTKTLNEKVAAIDYLIRHAQAALGIETVGVAVGVLYNGTVAMAEGYGLRNHTDHRSRITNRTLFAIASCTKAFTTYACDRLVTVDGTLEWSDLVLKHIPEFRTSNSYTTNHITVQDLVTHASGLPRHDLLQLHANFSRNEFLTRIPYLETNYNLRQVWQYNNIMYTVAGLVVQRVTGQTWEEVVRKRIFEPLKMRRTVPELSDVFRRKLDDVAVPHNIPRSLGVESIRTVPYLDVHVSNPAGGIYSCVDDLVKWVNVQLALSGRSKEMHSAQMNIAHDPITGPAFAYGYGWFLSYYHDHILVWHDGGINGFVAVIYLLPQLDLGIVILSNLSTLGGFVNSLALKIADIMTDRSSTDADLNAWVSAQAQEITVGRNATRWDDSNLARNQRIGRLQRYKGRYDNKGYGVVEVFTNGSRLFASYNTLRFELIPKKGLDFFSARSPFPDEYRFECSFVRDSSDRIYGFRFNLEPSVGPIFFEKNVSSDLNSQKYLESFIGRYGPIEIDVNRFKGILVASSGAVQYSGDLAPYKRNWFYLKRALIEFIVGKNEVSQMRIHQSELVTAYNKTKIV